MDRVPVHAPVSPEAAQQSDDAPHPRARQTRGEIGNGCTFSNLREGRIRHHNTGQRPDIEPLAEDRKSTRLNSSHSLISYAVFCLKKKKKITTIFLNTKKQKKTKYKTEKKKQA